MGLQWKFFFVSRNCARSQLPDCTRGGANAQTVLGFCIHGVCIREVSSTHFMEGSPAYASDARSGSLLVNQDCSGHIGEVES